jgi:hypothetical protein
MDVAMEPILQPNARCQLNVIPQWCDLGRGVSALDLFGAHLSSARHSLTIHCLYQFVGT